MPQIKRTVERQGDQSYLVLYVKADPYGVIDPEQLGPAIALLVGQTPRKMPAEEITKALRCAAAEHDLPL